MRRDGSQSPEGQTGAEHIERGAFRGAPFLWSDRQGSKKQLLLVVAIVFLGVPAAAPAYTQHRPSRAWSRWRARWTRSASSGRSARWPASAPATACPPRPIPSGASAPPYWLYGELQRSAARSGGRMSVELQSFIQGPAERVPEPTAITNVVATLRGKPARVRKPLLRGQRPLRLALQRPARRGV